MFFPSLFSSLNLTSISLYPNSLIFASIFHFNISLLLSDSINSAFNICSFIPSFEWSSVPFISPFSYLYSFPFIFILSFLISSISILSCPSFDPSLFILSATSCNFFIPIFACVAYSKNFNNFVVFPYFDVINVAIA